MKCPYCNNDMHIVSQFFETQANTQGGADIYSVVDLMCADTQCPAGKKRLPTARSRRLVKTAPSDQNGLYCCGQPLAYIGEGGYWLPGDAPAQRVGDTLTVTCRDCGQAQTTDVAGKEEVS